MLVDIIVFFIISMSFSCMWNSSSIMVPIRNFVATNNFFIFIRTPMLCPECSSFWLALFLSFLWNPLETQNIGFFSYIVVSNITLGLINHMLANILYGKEIIN